MFLVFFKHTKIYKIDINKEYKNVANEKPECYTVEIYRSAIDRLRNVWNGRNREKSGKIFEFIERRVSRTVAELLALFSTQFQVEERVSDIYEQKEISNLRRCTTSLARYGIKKFTFATILKMFNVAIRYFIYISQQVWILLHFKRKLWANEEGKKKTAKQRRDTKYKTKSEQLNKSAR